MSQLVLQPHQKAFAAAQEKFPALFGGIGNGKTLIAVRKVIEKSLSEQDNLILVGRLTYPELRDSTREMFMTQLQELARRFQWPKDFYQFKSQENSVTFKSTNSVVIFRHLDAPRNLLSMNLGGFYIDQAEEVDEEAFKTLQGRLRRKGIKHLQGYLTGNPQGHNWVYETYGMNDAGGSTNFLFNKDYRMITAPTFANVENLPEDYIPSLQRSYSPEWFARYVQGSWDVFEGQVFDVTKIKGFDKLPEIHMVFVACDPAISKDTKACNTAFCTLGIAADGKIYDLETVADKWNFYETLEEASRLLRKHTPQYLGVENTAYQQALVEACQRHFPYIQVIDLRADKDKFRRAKSVSHLVHLGLVHSNNKSLLNELSAFIPDAPVEQKKDRADAFVHCLHMIQRFAPTRFEVKQSPLEPFKDDPVKYREEEHKIRLKKIFEEEVAPYAQQSDVINFNKSDFPTDPRYY